MVSFFDVTNRLYDTNYDLDLREPADWQHLPGVYDVAYASSSSYYFNYQDYCKIKKIIFIMPTKTTNNLVSYWAKAKLPLTLGKVI